MGCNDAKVKRKELPYHPTSGKLLNVLVILGIAVADEFSEDFEEGYES